MEPIGQYKDGYSQYENKNKELKESISKLKIDGNDKYVYTDAYGGGKITHRLDDTEVVVDFDDFGKQVVKIVDIDMTEGGRHMLLQRINETHDAGKEFTKQYCPISNGRETITSIKGSKGDDVNAFGRSIMVLFADTCRNEYNLNRGGGTTSSCIFFDFEGNFVVRDHNHDLRDYKEIENVKVHIDKARNEYYDLISGIFKNEKTLEHQVNKNGEDIWFTGNMAYKVNNYAKTNHGITMLEALPHQSGNRYYTRGNSATGVTKPKVIDSVSNTHPIETLKSIIENN